MGLYGNLSHSSAEIPLTFFYEMVYSFRHLPSNNRILGAFGQISPLVSIYSLQSYLHIWVKKSTICVICRRIIVYWLHSGEISDPRSHSSTEIPLAFFYEMVYSFRHLPPNNSILAAFR